MLKVSYLKQNKFPYSSTFESLKAKVIENVEADGVLILAPHPDDAAVGCGGLIKHFTENGSKVKILYISDGSLGNSQGKRDRDLVQKREEEAFSALKVLKVTEVNFLRVKDGEIDKDRDLWPRIVEELRTRSFDLVLTPSGDDWNKDHKATNKALSDATERVRKNKPRIWQYYVWGLGEFNLLFPIDKYARYKKEAIECYKSQLKLKPYNEAFLGLNEYLGKGFGVSKYAEGFREE